MTRRSQLLLQAIASGFASSLLTELFPSGSSLTQLIPGLCYGLIFLIWLPAMHQSAKRVSAVLASVVSYIAAYHVATELAQRIGGQAGEAIAYPAAGLVGAALLRWLLSLSKALPDSAKQLRETAIAGALLGLAFLLPLPKDGGPWPFGAFFAIWQAGVGYVLLKQAKAK